MNHDCNESRKMSTKAGRVIPIHLGESKLKTRCLTIPTFLQQRTYETVNTDIIASANFPHYLPQPFQPQKNPPPQSSPSLAAFSTDHKNSYSAQLSTPPSLHTTPSPKTPTTPPHPSPSTPSIPSSIPSTNPLPTQPVSHTRRFRQPHPLHPPLGLPPPLLSLAPERQKLPTPTQPP